MVLPCVCCRAVYVVALQVNKGAWASWNFLGESGTSTDASSDAAVTVSYWLNRLQVRGGHGAAAQPCTSASVEVQLGADSSAWVLVCISRQHEVCCIATSCP